MFCMSSKPIIGKSQVVRSCGHKRSVTHHEKILLKSTSQPQEIFLPQIDISDSKQLSTQQITGHYPITHDELHGNLPNMKVLMFKYNTYVCIVNLQPNDLKQKCHVR